MKKNFTKIIVLSIMFLGMTMWTSATAQTYQTILWDNYTNYQNVPYCPCDSIKCVPPAGVTGVYWNAGETQHGDTVILPNGFNGDITCFWNGSQKLLTLRPIIPPVQPTFTNQNICGIETVILDAENPSSYGFTHYLWTPNGETTQTITVGAGFYQVTVSNLCGLITRPVTITEYNANQPNLGTDITHCQGSSVVLDPGTGYSSYLWIPGNSTDSTLSPTTNGTYIVQTTNAVGGCVDNDTIQVTFLAPPSQDIDLVTIDTINGNNRITWTNMYNEAVTMNIYRELTTNNYILVGTAPYTDETWTDTVSSKSQPWTYKIAVVDTCGNEGALSLYVKSIKSWVISVIGGFIVQWTPYEVESKSIVSQYNIYSGSNLSNLNYLAFVSGGVHVYELATFTDSLYVIGAQLSSKGAMNDALSNWIEEDDAVGIANFDLTDQISIYPNPATDGIYIQSEENVVKVDVTDLTGRIILSSNEKMINISSVSSGTYLIKVTTQAGKIGYQKFIKQ